MKKIKNHNKAIHNIHEWFSHVLKIDDAAMQLKFVESFCNDSNFKLPISLRNSGGAVKQGRIIRLKYKFVEKNWSKFVNFVSAYLVLHDEVNKKSQSNVGNTPSESGLIDSLVKF